MSVTFRVDTTPTGAFEARCDCVREDQEAQVTFASYDLAEAWMTAYIAAPYPLPGCLDDLCLAYRPMLTAVVEEVNAPEVNVSNVNAREILAALGLADPETGMVEDLCGTLPAEDFLGRVLLALALEPVSAPRPAVRVQSEDTPFGIGATMIEGARREGYIQTRLSELRSVADYAKARGLDLIWS